MVTIERVPEDESADRRRVVEIGRSAFPWLQGRLLHETPHVFAARHDGRIVGGTVSEILDPSDDRQVGLVTWIFSASEARGLGAGSRLLERTVEHLESQGCDAVVAIVRWLNTSSSKLFASSGFVRTSTRDVARQFGIAGTARLYWDAMYLAPGFDLWSKDLVDADDSPEDEPAGANEADATNVESHAPSWLRGIESFGVNALLFVVAGVSLLGVGVVADQIAAVLLVPLLVLAVRYLPARIATGLDDEDWRFWSWGNAYPPALVLAALGLFVPVPGNLAPTRRVWTFEEELDRLGPAAACSCVLLVALYAGALFHGRIPIEMSAATADLVVYGLWVFLLVDVLFVTFPFNTYAGTVVYRWNRLAWAALAIPTVALLGVVVLRILPVG